MIHPDRIAAFAALALVVIVIPGPSVMFVISRALAGGRRTALLTVVGNAGGEYVQVVAVALGIGALVERSVLALSALRLIGAGYIVFLGIRTIVRRRAIAAQMLLPRTPPAGRASLRQGFIVGVSNPKTIVFMVAVLPQFVVVSAGAVTEQLLILGAVFALIALASDSVWALFAGTARDWFARSPRRLEIAESAGGAGMVGVGVTLALSGQSK